MTSRARRKRRARGGDSETEPQDDGEPSVGGPRTERFFAYFFGMVGAAGAGAYAGIAVFESWRVGIALAVVGACVGLVAVWRGVEMF